MRFAITKLALRLVFVLSCRVGKPFDYHADVDLVVAAF